MDQVARLKRSVASGEFGGSEDVQAIHRFDPPADGGETDLEDLGHAIVTTAADRDVQEFLQHLGTGHASTGFVDGQLQHLTASLLESLVVARGVKNDVGVDEGGQLVVVRVLAKFWAGAVHFGQFPFQLAPRREMEGFGFK